MAYDAFLKLDGISGGSTDPSHKGEIDIMSWSWGESQTGGGGAGRGAGAGKVSMQDFHFSMDMNVASPQLFTACATGKHLPSATLTLRNPGSDGPGLEFLKITLANVLVSSYQTGGNLMDSGQYSPLGPNSDIPIDQFTLNFAKIEYSYSGQSAAGGVVGPQSFDVTGN